jgi:hypothetical protein
MMAPFRRWSRRCIPSRSWRIRPCSLPGVPPSPLRGYLARKIFIFSSLQGVSVCKILKANKLGAKYSLSIS